jgi:hypothetical protein
MGNNFFLGLKKCPNSKVIFYSPCGPVAKIPYRGILWAQLQFPPSLLPTHQDTLNIYFIRTGRDCIICLTVGQADGRNGTSRRLQHCPVELSVMMQMSYICTIHSVKPLTPQMLIWSIWNVIMWLHRLGSRRSYTLAFSFNFNSFKFMYKWSHVTSCCQFDRMSRLEARNTPH